MNLLQKITFLYILTVLFPLYTAEQRTSANINRSLTSVHHFVHSKALMLLKIISENDVKKHTPTCSFEALQRTETLAKLPFGPNIKAHRDTIALTSMLRLFPDITCPIDDKTIHLAKKHQQGSFTITIIDKVIQGTDTFFNISIINNKPSSVHKPKSKKISIKKTESFWTDLYRNINKPIRKKVENISLRKQRKKALKKEILYQSIRRTQLN